MSKSRLFRWQYFLWVPLLLVFYFFWFVFGTPYFIWSYSWLDSGQGYSPYAERRYTQCNYLKLSDVSQTHRVRYPSNGECAWVVFPNKRWL